MKFAGVLKVTKFSSTWRKENDITVKGSDVSNKILEKTLFTRKLIRKANFFGNLDFWVFFDLYKCKVVLSRDKKSFFKNSLWNTQDDGVSKFSLLFDKNIYHY